MMGVWGFKGKKRKKTEERKNSRAEEEKKIEQEGNKKERVFEEEGEDAFHVFVENCDPVTFIAAQQYSPAQSSVTSRTCCVNMRSQTNTRHTTMITS